MFEQHEDTKKALALLLEEKQNVSIKLLNYEQKIQELVAENDSISTKLLNSDGNFKELVAENASLSQLLAGSEKKCNMLEIDYKTCQIELTDSRNKVTLELLELLGLLGLLGLFNKTPS